MSLPRGASSDSKSHVPPFTFKSNSPVLEKEASFARGYDLKN